MAGFEVSTNGRFCPVHRGQAEPGSVRLSFTDPRKPGHQADVVQRGNAFEVVYSDGKPPGPAEALFVFRDVAERSGAMEDTVTFLDSLFAGRVIAYRERIDSVTAWLRADGCRSILRFGTLDDITTRKPDTVEAVYYWRRE